MGKYSEFKKESIAKVCNKAVRIRKQIEAAGVENYDVKFSKGNRKTGDVLSVSTIPVVDCGKNCKACAGGCYDVRHDLIYTNVATNRAINSAIVAANMDRYFDSISRMIHRKKADSFRFHIGGDIKNAAYFAGMVRVAAENPNCRILAFTKEFEIVNGYIQAGGVIPENLRIIFSAWPGLEIENPYNFPVSYPEFEADSDHAKFNESIPANVHHCGGNCLKCFECGFGCFWLDRGESVTFKAH